MQQVTQRLLDLKVRGTGAARMVSALAMTSISSAIARPVGAQSRKATARANACHQLLPQLSGAGEDIPKLVEAQPALLLQAAVQHDGEANFPFATLSLQPQQLLQGLFIYLTAELPF